MRLIFSDCVCTQAHDGRLLLVRRRVLPVPSGVRRSARPHAVRVERQKARRMLVAAPDNSGGSVNALAAATGGLPLHSADSSYGSITALRQQQRWRVATPQDTAAMASSPCVGGSSDGVLPRRRRWQRRQRRCVDASNDGRLPRHRAAATTAVCRAAAETAATKASPRFGGKGDGGLPAGLKAPD